MMLQSKASTQLGYQGIDFRADTRGVQADGLRRSGIDDRDFEFAQGVGVDQLGVRRRTDDGQDGKDEAAADTRRRTRPTGLHFPFPLPTMLMFVISLQLLSY